MRSANLAEEYRTQAGTTSVFEPTEGELENDEEDDDENVSSVDCFRYTKRNREFNQEELPNQLIDTEKESIVEFQSFDQDVF